MTINESINSTNKSDNDDYEDFEIFHVGDVVNVAAYSVMAVGRLIKINQMRLLYSLYWYVATCIFPIILLSDFCNKIETLALYKVSRTLPFSERLVYVIIF